MKKLALIALLMGGSVAAQARGFHYYGPFRAHYGPLLSFSYGFYPYAWYPTYYSYSYPYYPAYSYPAYGYDYAYARPNYAVNGTLLGALTGGIIGNSIHHQGWEGAGIGAAAGLLLGSLAEHDARTYERSYPPAPAASYSQPNYIANAPTVSDPPTVPAAPQVQNAAPAYRPASSMSSANSLFGR